MSSLRETALVSGLITIRLLENGKLVDEETIVSEHNEIHSFAKTIKVLGEVVEIQITFDPPMQFKETPTKQQEVENG